MLTASFVLRFVQAKDFAEFGVFRLRNCIIGKSDSGSCVQ